MSTEQPRKQVALHADIAAPPETVWRLILDLNRMGEWTSMRTTLGRLKAAAEARSR